MKFLTEVDNQEYSWDNTVAMYDKNLMAAIEEYFHITDSNSNLQDKRETLLKGLIEPDKHATDQAVKDVFVEEVTLRSILTYFGIREEQKIDDQIKAFNSFAEPIAYGGELSFASYNKALYLFKLNRNDKAHNIIRQEVYQRKIAFQFLAFTYIGLVYLLRLAWHTKKDTLNSKYSKPDDFLIPEQTLRIVVNRKDSSNDNIIGYEFIPNIRKGDYRIIKQVDPTPQLDITVAVRKYDKFKLIIKYGTSESKSPVDIVFGDKGDTTLSYYYWNPTWLINLPSSSSIQPGLSIGADSTEELITKLLDDINKYQDGAAKQKISAITEEVLSALEPTLQRIKELSGSPKRSADDKTKMNDLIQKVNEALQKQINKNDEKFKKLMDKMDALEANQSREFKNLSTKFDGHYKDIIEDFQKLSIQINKEKQDTLLSDKTRFWQGKHLPHYMAIIGAILLYAYTIFNDYSLTYLKHMWMWIVTPLIISVALLLWTQYFYKTTVSNRLSIIKPHTKWISVGLIAVALVIAELTNFIIPNNTIKKLVANYDFFAQHSEGDNARAAMFMEDYLNKKPSDDERVRVKLARYYLNFSGETEKAIQVTSPMVADMQNYKDGILAYVEALYENKDYKSVRKIIKDYKKIFNDSTPVTERLEGIMYCKKQGGYPKDIFIGQEKLNNAVKAGDAEAKYLFGYYLTNDITDWAPRPDKTGKREIDIADLDLVFGIYLLQEASASLPKASLELGNLYSDINMLDSAIYYYDKVIEQSVRDKDLYNQALFRRGLIQERKGNTANSDLRTLVISGYKPALLHDAIKENKPEVIIDVYDSVEYEGYRYLDPKVLAHIALGQKEEALDLLRKKWKNGGFSMDFINGIEKLTGSKYTDKDSIEGMKLMQAVSDSCDYAKIICLYRDLEQKLINRQPVNSLEIKTLDDIGDKIPLASVLSSLILRKYSQFGLAEWSAIKAANQNHPGGALGLTSTCRYMPRSYYDNIWKDLHKSNQFLHFMQVALRKSPDKQICMHYGIATDKVVYDLQKKAYPNRRLSFWTDVVIANGYTSFEYYLLNAWSQMDKDLESVKKNKKKLVYSLLDKINLKERDLKGKVYREQLDILASAINDLSDEEIDSLKDHFKGKAYALTMIANKKHTEPLERWEVSTDVIDMKLPISIERILNEFDELAE